MVAYGVRDNVVCSIDILDDLQAYMEYMESQSGATLQGPGRTISFWHNYLIGIGCVIIIVGTEI